VVFKLRSVRSIVIAPAKTGKERSNKIVVIKTAHAKRGIRSRNIPKTRKLLNVLMKLIAPKIEDTPARCKEKIAKSTDLPAWAILLARGG